VYKKKSTSSINKIKTRKLRPKNKRCWIGRKKSWSMLRNSRISD